MSVNQRQRHFVGRLQFVHQLAEGRGDARDKGIFKRRRLALQIVAGAEQRTARTQVFGRGERIGCFAKPRDVFRQPVDEFDFESIHGDFGALDGGHVETSDRSADFRLQHVRRHKDLCGLVFTHSVLSTALWAGPGATSSSAVGSPVERRSGPRYSSVARRRRHGPK